MVVFLDWNIKAIFSYIESYAYAHFA